MKSNHSSRSGLFLMELIISILFFALAGAVCIRLFVSSHLISRDSVTLNHALEWCQNTAEIFYGCDGDADKMAQVLSTPCHSSTDQWKHFILYFDKDFEPVISEEITDSLDLSKVCYMISVTVREENSLLYCNIRASEATNGSVPDSIYELSVSLFPEMEVSYEK